MIIDSTHWKNAWMSARVMKVNQCIHACIGLPSCILIFLIASVHTSAHSADCDIPGQIYMDCAPACDATCNEPNPICIYQCTQRCMCPHGLLLDEDSKRCVKVCPKRRCSVQGQVFQACTPTCEITCREPKPYCTTECARRCACLPGMLLDEEQKICVKSCGSETAGNHCIQCTHCMYAFD